MLRGPALGTVVLEHADGVEGPALQHLAAPVAFVGTKTFAPLTGDLTAIQSGTGGAVQNFGYSYDVLGRLTTRSDANTAQRKLYL